MKKKIGIDLDKTIFDCKSIVYSFLNQLKYNNCKRLKHQDIDDKGIYKCNFVNKVFKLFNPRKYIPFQDAVETIKYLHDNGYEIHLVSNRPNIKQLIAMTIDSLQLKDVKYDKLIMGCSNKAIYAEQMGLDYFIDNDFNVCKELSKSGHTKPIFFNYSGKNVDSKLKNTGITGFSSWSAIKRFMQLEDKNLSRQLSQKESEIDYDDYDNENYAG